MTKPLTGYEKEIAILHAEANQSAELIEEFKALINRYKQAVERVRELHKPFGENNEWCDHCEIGQNSGYEWADYPCPTIKELDGDD